jgi:hypothetical protein
MSPRHEASAVERLPVQIRGRRSSTITAEPYAPMRGLQEIQDGDRVDSWWGDQLMLADSQERSRRASGSPLLRGRDQGDPDRPGIGTPDDLAAAQERLRLARVFAGRELRDMSASGNPFVPAGVAVYVAEEFSAAARARASLFDALPQRLLPRFGLKVEVPKLTGGGSVAVVASENTAVSETDPTTGLASSGRAYVAGIVDVSRQLLELSRPSFDQVISADLGRALGVAVDQQLVAGTNLNGQTEGLATVSGINSVAYTDASPTPNELVSKIWAGFQAIAESGGGPSEPGDDNYLIAMAPRRISWLAANTGQTAAVPALPALPGRVVASPGIRTTLGAGTNEDEIYLIARGEVFVGADPPTLAVYPEIGSGTLTVRLQARQSLAAMFSRQPKAIARISGTGLVAPTL